MTDDRKERPTDLNQQQREYLKEMSGPDRCVEHRDRP